MLAAAVIVFREALEAALIVGIVLAATKGVIGSRRWVAGGIAAGILGAALVALFADRIGNAFGGNGQELFNAFVLGAAVLMRSEEHTSELQSLMRISYAVFCLKKKK